MFVVRVRDGSPRRATGRTWEVVVMLRVTRRPKVAKADTGPERWARWSAMVADGMTKAEVARSARVSRAAVTAGLRPRHT